MSIRPRALSWLSKNFGVESGLIYSSKLFSPDQSWTRRNAWWIKLPYDRLAHSGPIDVHIVCEVDKYSNDFFYLKVPATYFIGHEQDLIVFGKNLFNLFLSAEPDNLFQDERGSGVHFSSFLMNK